MFSVRDLIIPEPLFGHYGKVRRRWQRITTLAMVDGSWRNALADVDYLTLTERTEDIVTDNPARFRGEGELRQLCVVHDLLFRHSVPLISCAIP